MQKEVIDLRDYLDAVKKNLRFILLGTFLITMFSAFVTYLVMEPVYDAKTKLMVHEIPKKDEQLQVADIDSLLKLIPTYSEIIESPAVVDKAASKLEMKSDEISSQIQVTTDPVTQLITIKAEHKDPRIAVLLANTMAEMSIEEINSVMKLDNVFVLNRASMNKEPVRPNPFLNIGIALIFSLFAGVLIVCLSRFFFAKFRSYNEIQSALGVPILGTTTKVRPGNYNESKFASDYLFEQTAPELFRRLVVRSTQQSEQKEGYRKLKTNLSFMNQTKDLRSIAVTGSRRKEGTTLTSGNLALLLAHSGKKTVFVDGNIHNPASHEMFATKNITGLTAFMTGKKNLSQVIQSTFHPNLDLITAGRDLPHTADHFTLNQVSSFMNDLKRNYDYVIVDCPPIEDSADTILFANQTDGCVFVVNYKNGKMSQIISSFNQLKECGANIAGVFVNRYRH
ncbi:polysaccharide biosynthesis tyrosine autokinase [Halobacillus halophilus]|uniref:polysaccharide biosynthesis tyrosine autokinase n=1 Tax=Halobacillus halophilus TaxID=1570 RepID=UPI001CD52571|nr:polysaccharide biosynthesis tyrosine autokinase [Halobacillus halophilus]MCA1012706.1 polysaccharide biosynthesis tyrosine autokinase [Halobacillus halophilus]